MRLNILSSLGDFAVSVNAYHSLDLGALLSTHPNISEVRLSTGARTWVTWAAGERRVTIPAPADYPAFLRREHREELDELRALLAR